MIRARTDADLPRLAEVLLAQRAGSGYPVSLPPGGPVDLIRRERELGAWVAEVDGVVVGHVSVTTFPADPTGATLAEARQYADAHGCQIDQLGVVSALFVDESARGAGLGRALMARATEACRAAGLRPCLDVVVAHADAVRLYERLGWDTVAELVPDWLPAGKGPVVTMVLRSPATLRERRPDDLPRLVEILAEQRPASGYPVQEPTLAMVQRPRELGAWVADVEGRLVGHVSVTVLPDRLDDDQAAFAAVCADTLGCAIDELGVVSALFVDPAARGAGVGRALMERAAEEIRGRGLHPCLDVVSIHRDGRRLYEALGWEVAAELWPDWLPAELGPDVAMVLRGGA